MEFGAFVSGLVTGLREGVEAALIVSIILAYLARTGNGRYAGRIWLGVASALVLSVVLGVLIFVTIGEFQAPYEQIFEGATMLLAAVVVTWMLFWMRRQAASVSGELRAAVDRALTEGGLVGLTALAFLAVIREGLETALFLVAQASAARTDRRPAPRASWWAPSSGSGSRSPSASASTRAADGSTSPGSSAGPGSSSSSSPPGSSPMP